MTTPDSDKPAILGGTSVRPQGPPDWPITDSAIHNVFAELQKTGDWGRYHGPHCEKLIAALGEHHYGLDAILCSSGTAAVELCLRGMQIGPGDEVILSAYEFKANFANILTVGALPVLVDVRPDDWQMNADLIVPALSSKTKAIIATSLHGGSVDLKQVRTICDQRRLFLLEDICQVEGTQTQSKLVGLWGDAAVISFGGSKLLSAGRGGAILSNNDEIKQRIRLYTQRGNDAYPLSEMQAAIVLPQLEQLHERNRTRREAAERLFAALKDSPGLLPFRSPHADSTAGYYKVGFKYDAVSFRGVSRDQFSEAMVAEGFALYPGFRSLHRIISQRRFRTVGDLSNADRADEGILVLHHPILLERSDWQQDFVRAVERIRQHADLLV